MILAYNNETHYANHSKIIVLRKQRGPRSGWERSEHEPKASVDDGGHGCSREKRCQPFLYDFFIIIYQSHC